MPEWWLITWTTYGTWLPGDPRGFQTWRGREYVPPPKRYAAEGERIYDPSNYAERHRVAQQIAGDPVHLTDRQRQIVLDSLVREIAEIDVLPAVLSVGHTHVHWLAQFGKTPIRLTVGRIKSAATRSLNGDGMVAKRPWTKNCHMKSKETDAEFRHAFRYVYDHRTEGCLVYVWPSFMIALDDLLRR